MPLILLRLFQETPDEQTAISCAHRVCDLLGAAGYLVIKMAVKPYWKIPEYFEIVVELNAGTEHSGIDRAMERLGRGWLKQQPGEAIWNPGEEATFADELVRWAQLEVID